jgi:hypothetical protein
MNPEIMNQLLTAIQTIHNPSTHPDERKRVQEVCDSFIINASSSSSYSHTSLSIDG